MTDRETWLSQIRNNPSDWQAMLVFADWLEEEEGDLLAAEQWRWMAVTHGCSHQIDSESTYADAWPTGTPRKGIGCELKPSYFNQAVRNLEQLAKEMKGTKRDDGPTLFSMDDEA